MLIIHGVPLSQPFRSVIWPCLLKGLPFTIQIAVPGGKPDDKYSTRRHDFLQKFPLGTIPSIEDTTTGVCLSEAPAILAYLSSRHGWDDVYPAASSIVNSNDDMRLLRNRARIDEYCHWHHSNLRSLTRASFRRYIKPHSSITDDMIGLWKKEATHALKVLERSYLSPAAATSGGGGTHTGLGKGGGGYLLGTDHPTAVDFMAYEEVCQVGPDYGNVLDFASYPHITSWLGRMKALPWHDYVHASLRELGPLSGVEPPVDKDRLRMAFKVGIKALAEAQKDSCAASSSKAKL